MWYKVNELQAKGFNKSQISRELGLARATIRRYLSMNESEFHSWIEKGKNLPKKLQRYYAYVKELLGAYPYLSSAQVEDRLKERFTDLPQVHSKTVYNFVMSIRKMHQIDKNKEHEHRQYQKLPEPEYGQQAQADFGRYYMLLPNGVARKLVYFFVMVLCRSRQKFIYFQSHPFTTQTTILAHEKAFTYFQGQPKKILYDQDRVLMVEENMGDILLTQEFSSYCSQMDFAPEFCRKADPQSKGKVENVVGYVKKNFLQGRIFEGDDALNHSAQAWLYRTGNGKKHASTQKVPHEEWLIERTYLLPFTEDLNLSNQIDYKSYTVRKDNTISYRGCFYTVPIGTYQGQDTHVLLQERNGELLLFDSNQQLLSIHELSTIKGVTVRNADHIRDKSQSIQLLKISVTELMQNTPKAIVFLDLLEKQKPRYVRDNLLLLNKRLPDLEQEYVQKALDLCLENNVYNANNLVEAAKHFQKQETQNKKVVSPLIEVVQPGSGTSQPYEPQTSKVNIYEQIM